jgi:hypothetical protein
LDAQDDEENVLLPSSNSSNPSTAVAGAEFILKTRDGKHRPPLVNDSKVLVQNTIQIINRGVMEALSSGGVTDSIISEVQAVFCDEKMRNPFYGLETQYQQDKFISENFNYVVSKIRLCMCACLHCMVAGTSRKSVGFESEGWRW